jgi:hypothetical protein
VNPGLGAAVLRAFVVHLSDEADPASGLLVGRVEHLSSGGSAEFRTSEELVAFILRWLRASLVTGGD